MAQLTREHMKIFGISAAATQFGQIGSLAAGSPVNTKDIDTIQGLGQYDNGFFAITNSASEPPRIEDMNSLYFLATRQLSYLFQAGIPEWDVDQEYYEDVSIVNYQGILYKSKTDANIGHVPLGDTTNWGGFGIAGLTSDLIFEQNSTIGRNTADGSDNGSLILSGGGAVGITRGAYVTVYGNENPALPGVVRLVSGNVSGGYTEILTGSSIPRLRVLESGRILIGPTLPADDGTSDLQLNGVFKITSFSGIGIVLQNDTSDSLEKNSRIAVGHYSNSEEPLGLIMGISRSETNSVRIGGGSAINNASTSVAIYTASNSTTVSGTERFLINSAGRILMGPTLPTDDGTSALQVNGTVSQAGDHVFTTSSVIRRNTADGSDDGVMILTGGGAEGVIRGGYIRLFGNEATNFGGNAQIIAGDVSTGNILFYTGEAHVRQKILNSGRNLMGATLPADDSGYDVIIGSNGLKVNGKITGNGNLILGTGSADRSIQFAGDATLLWDESTDALEINKRFNLTGVGGITIGLGNISIAGGIITNIFQGLTVGRNWLPSIDNTYDLGDSSYKWDNIYAVNGTIQTSDARMKTEVTLLSNKEKDAAKLMIKEIGSWKWKKAIEEKGENARKHIGLTVQKAIEIMKSCDLDPFEYGFICYNKIEGKDEDIYGFRYSELIMFLLGSQLFT